MSRLSKNIKTVLGPYHQIHVGGNRNFPKAGWNDLVFPMASGRIKGNGDEPDWVAWHGGLYAWRFNDGEVNELWVSFHVEHDYLDDSAMYPHIHWSTADTATGVVRWGIEYSVGQRGGVFATPTTIYVEHDAQEGVAAQHYVTEVSDAQAALITAPEPDTLIQMRVFRDGTHANDTFSGHVYGLTADIHYQLCRFATLNKAAPFNG